VLLPASVPSASRFFAGGLGRRLAVPEAAPLLVYIPEVLLPLIADGRTFAPYLGRPAGM